MDLGRLWRLVVRLLVTRRRIERLSVLVLSNLLVTCLGFRALGRLCRRPLVSTVF